MAEILQGTTPALVLAFAAADLPVSDIAALELAVANGDALALHHLDDVELDALANTITYHFTQAETLALDPNDVLRYQLRARLSGGSVVGTKKTALAIDDLMSEEVL